MAKGTKKKKHTYTSAIELGKRYDDPITDIEGVATVISFGYGWSPENSDTQVLVSLLYQDGLVAGEPKHLAIGPARMKLDGGNLDRLDKEHKYKSDIELGKVYTDELTGITGRAASIHFHMDACEQIELVFKKEDGKPGRHVVDVLRLKDEEGEQQTAKKTGGPERFAPTR